MADSRIEVDPEVGGEEYYDDITNTVDEEPLLEKETTKRVSWSLPSPLKNQLSYKATKRSKSSWLQSPMKVAQFTILIILAGVGIASLVNRVYHYFGPPQIGYVICHCGSSVDEAISRGCKFDLLGPSWAPDHCRDDELSAEFLKAGNGPNGTWEFWHDHNHTQPMSIEEVSMLANDPKATFYSTWEFHVKHCMYQWRKHWRGLERGYTKMDVENTGLGHIQHCEGVILRGLPVRAKIELNVPRIGWVPPVDHDDLHTGPIEH